MLINKKDMKSDSEENTDNMKGIEISYEDIEKAFKILDEKNAGTKVSLNELKKKIPIREISTFHKISCVE